MSSFASAVPGSSAPSTSAMPMSKLYALFAFAVLDLSAPFASAVLVPGLSTPSAPAVPMPRLSTPSASVMLVPGLSTPFPSAMPMPGLSAPFAFAISLPRLFVLSLSAMPVPRLFALSASAVPMPGLFTPSLSTVPMSDSSAPSAFAVPVPLLSSLFPIWLSPRIPTPIPKKQRLGQWDQIMKRASFKKVASTFISLLPPVERRFLSLLPFSSIGEKQSFDMAFNFDCQQLANDYTRDNVDLSFACCQCPTAVKANKPW